ncbi:MAG: hypothetical protein RIM80_24055 [Alphaproteobacteria bacterium]
MRTLFYAAAIAGLAFSPAIADTMPDANTVTCGEFVNLDAETQIGVAEKIEPKSVEAKLATDKAVGATASSGKAGTVDPQMTEKEKVADLVAACDGESDMLVSAAAHKAWGAK